MPVTRFARLYPLSGRMAGLTDMALPPFVLRCTVPP